MAPKPMDPTYQQSQSPFVRDILSGAGTAAVNPPSGVKSADQMRLTVPVNQHNRAAADAMPSALARATCPDAF